MINIKRNDSLVNAHFNEVYTRIIDRITTLKKQKYIKIKNKRSFRNSQIPIIFEYFTNVDNLRQLITANPNQLEEIINNIEHRFPKLINRTKSKEKPIEYIVIYNIFVDSLYENGDYFDKNQFIKNLDIKTCPYCNRNYIYAIEKDSKTVKPQIDHFFPKSIYPFLAISFYNLIPCCQTCNGLGAKEDKDIYIDPKYILKNPYSITNSDFKFTYFPRDTDFFKINRTNLKEIENTIRIGFKQSIDSHLNCFHLDKFYEKHKDIVFELLIVRKYYAESQISEFEKYDFTRDEIYRFLLRNFPHEHEFHRRPFSKLTNDIAVELGLFNILPK